MVVTGSDAKGFWAALSMALPTIPPMARAPFTNLVPDWMVVDAQRLRARGEGRGGVLGAGYFDEVGVDVNFDFVVVVGSSCLMLIQEVNCLGNGQVTLC